MHLIDDRQRRTGLFADLPRRAALGQLGAGLAVGLGLMTRGARAAGQAGTPMADPAMLPPLIQDWLAAWGDDPSRADALYTDDAVLEDIGGGAEYPGRDAIRGHIEEVRSALPDRAYEVRSAFVADGWAAVEFVFTGSYTGALPGLPAGSGQPVSLPGVAILELAGDQIRREAHYYDAYSLLIQLGALPAPEPAGTPAA